MMLQGPSHTDLHAVVDEVWSTFLGPEEPLLPARSDSASADGATWSAATSVTGAWNGVVTVEVPDAVAHTATERMLGLEPGQTVTTEDVADAVGELVNMIGGSVKSLMPGPGVLSLPLVARGTIASPSDLTEVSRLDLTWAGAPLHVTVLARRDAPAQAADRSAEHRESA
ncbi:MAG: chemotaxis protein CheX [Nocardioides sp.]|nr:chemotaxis protein CheX [Nocardioides sp.]